MWISTLSFLAATLGIDAALTSKAFAAAALGQPRHQSMKSKTLEKSSLNNGATFPTRPAGPGCLPPARVHCAPRSCRHPWRRPRATAPRSPGSIVWLARYYRDLGPTYEHSATLYHLQNPYVNAQTTAADSAALQRFSQAIKLIPPPGPPSACPWRRLPRYAAKVCDSLTVLPKVRREARGGHQNIARLPIRRRPPTCVRPRLWPTRI